ncbi:MAG TPA: hypothetical protein VKZ63_12645, partial [Kofleriaceae bacterium]|nr:hypothetical protein [Kofleriaceae bacterium]
MRRAPIAAGALAAAALAAACGGGPEVLVPDTTVVLDQATLGALEEVSEDRATFRFARSTALLDELEVGDIIVADVFAPHLPAGALRRVRSIERSAGVVVTTDPASLAEAIERGSIRERIDLREEGMRSLRVLPGVRPDISATGLYFGLNDVVLFDGDGDPDTDDRVVMNGNIAIEPSLDLVIEIDGFSLEEASIAIVGEVSGNVNIDARREATLPGEPIKLASIGLGTYTFFVGPVPVVIGSYVDLEVGVDGKVTAAMNVGFQTEAEARVGFGYKDGSFAPIGEIAPAASVELPSFSDGAVGSAKLFAGPRLVVSLYGIPVGFARLETYVRADVDVLADPWWCLSAGMEGSAGIDIDITIDFWIFDIEIELIEWETPPIGDSVDLGCADGPAPSHEPGSGGGGGEEAIVTFARSYGGDSNEGFTAVLPTGDGGALLAGATNSFSPTPHDAWLVKVDALGHVGWQLAYADLYGATDVIDMGDGYLITAGRLGATVDTIDLVRVDENGLPMWARRYGHPDGLGPARVVATADGGFLVAGTLSLSSAADFFAARFDAGGEVLWSRAYGGADGDAAWAAVATSDGGFLLVGTTSSFGVTLDAMWAVKLDA